MPRHTDDAASALATARSSGDATQCQGEVTEKDLTEIRKGKLTCRQAKKTTPEVYMCLSCFNDNFKKINLILNL